MEKSFGDKASQFTYTKLNNLVFNGDVSSFSKEEKAAYNSLNLITQTIQNINYEEIVAIAIVIYLCILFLYNHRKKRCNKNTKWSFYPSLL